MPKEVRRKIGDIFEVEQVPTLWDKIKEALGAIAGMAFLIVILVAIFT